MSPHAQTVHNNVLLQALDAAIKANQGATDGAQQAWRARQAAEQVLNQTHPRVSA